MKRFWMGVVVAALFVALPGVAHADAVYQVGGAFTCPMNSCLGGSYTLQFAGDNSGNTFTVMLTATTTESGSGSPAIGDYISSVEFGDGKKIASASLTGAPGGIANWGGSTPVFGNLNNAGCNTGNAPNACDNQAPTGGLYTLALANGSSYSWTWNVVFAEAGLDLNPADMHIGLQYEDGPNTSDGLIVSESGASRPVPEPSSLLLLGAGLLGIIGVAGRKLITS